MKLTFLTRALFLHSCDTSDLLVTISFSNKQLKNVCVAAEQPLHNTPTHMAWDGWAQNHKMVCVCKNIYLNINTHIPQCYHNRCHSSFNHCMCDLVSRSPQQFPPRHPSILLANQSIRSHTCSCWVETNPREQIQDCIFVALLMRLGAG